MSTGEGTGGAPLGGGVAVALATPLNGDGSLDLPALERHVKRMVDGGVSILMPCGTTGESATLTPDEQKRVVEASVEAAGGRVPIYAGAGTNSTAEAQDLARAARAAGADGVLSVVPYYNKPSPEGLYRHFRAVAEAAGIPVMLYNVPSRTGTNMDAATTLRVAELENVVGVKEASGDVEQIADIVAGRPEGFRVFAGDDSFTLPVLALGGEGVVSVTANEAPAPMAEMVAAAREGRWDRAREIQYRLLPLFQANFVESNPVPVKEALAMMGHMEAYVRPPLAPLRDDSRQVVRRALEETGLLK